MIEFDKKKKNSTESTIFAKAIETASRLVNLYRKARPVHNNYVVAKLCYLQNSLNVLESH